MSDRITPLFADIVSETVAATGEIGLISRIRAWLGSVNPPAPFGIGDDCAVVPGCPGNQVITVDPVVYGRHFDETVSPRDVGAKLLKRNLSDLAAMGALPTVAVVSLGLEKRLRTRWLESFYRGIAAAARQYRVAVVGGDITQMDQGFIASLTLLGKPAARRLLTRRGAEIGDAVFVTGALGGSLLGRHFRFAPRLAEGAWLARQSQVVAMMDVSDGVAKDLHALAPIGAEPIINHAAVPISRAAQLLSKTSGRTPLHHALSDGEDYELLFVVRKSTRPDLFRAKWNQAFDTPVHHIGTFSTPGAALAPGFQRLSELHGYEHLR